MSKCKLTLSNDRETCNIKGKIIYLLHENDEFALRINIRGSNQPHHFILSCMNEFKPIDLTFEMLNIKHSIKDAYIVSFKNYILVIRTLRKL